MVRKKKKNQSPNWYYCAYIFTYSLTKHYVHSIIYFFPANIAWISLRIKTKMYKNSGKVQPVARMRA